MLLTRELVKQDMKKIAKMIPEGKACRFMMLSMMAIQGTALVFITGLAAGSRPSLLTDMFAYIALFFCGGIGAILILTVNILQSLAARRNDMINTLLEQRKTGPDVLM